MGLVTIAGDVGGAAGYVDGFGLAAKFSNPLDMVFNSDFSKLYIADHNNYAIRCYDVATSEVTTVIQFADTHSKPTNLYLHDDSTLYVTTADEVEPPSTQAWYSRLYVINPTDGTVTTTGPDCGGAAKVDTFRFSSIARSLEGGAHIDVKAYSGESYGDYYQGWEVLDAALVATHVSYQHTGLGNCPECLAHGKFTGLAYWAQRDGHYAGLAGMVNPGGSGPVFRQLAYVGPTSNGFQVESYAISSHYIMAAADGHGHAYIYCPASGGGSDCRTSWASPLRPATQLAVNPDIGPVEYGATDGIGDIYNVFGVLPMETAGLIHKLTAVRTDGASVESGAIQSAQYTLSAELIDVGVTNVPLYGMAIAPNNMYFFSAACQNWAGYWNDSKWQFPLPYSGIVNTVPVNTIQYLSYGGGGWQTQLQYD